uniref:DAGKa domain-containing protein n=1 Tax=Macrostomum lignano TaxID=282301 RepID=A0A1I8F7T7_9PLAT
LMERLAAVLGRPIREPERRQIFVLLCNVKQRDTLDCHHRPPAAPELGHGFIGTLGGRDAALRFRSLHANKSSPARRFRLRSQARRRRRHRRFIKRRLFGKFRLPPGQCCGMEFYGPRALAYRRVCKPASADSDCPTGSGVEQNLFNQYYSGLFR